MIKYNDAVRTARSLLGTPYSEMDCIRLIVMIIRRSPGGDPEYRCEGTNWLWKSAENAKKYRHLLWRQEGTAHALGGMLVFRRRKGDVHHVGFVTREGTVIHASSVQGHVVETPLDGTWELLAGHRELETDETREREEQSPSPIGEMGANTGQNCGEEQNAYTSMIREDGMMIRMEGRWRVAED